MAGSERRSSFDPVVVGQQESAAWAAYYRREWAAFLRAAVGMVAAGFGMRRRETLAGAWDVLQAKRMWAPDDNDPDSARRYMRRFYDRVVTSGWGTFDTDRAAELELEWWRVHRARQHGEGEPAALIGSLDALYSHVYGVAPGTMREAARLRAEAMDLSDAWVAAGCRLDDPLLARERKTLVGSYAALREAVERHGAHPYDPVRASD